MSRCGSTGALPGRCLLRWNLDLPFLPVRLSDRDVLEPRLRAASYRLCEYTFATLCCWQPLNATEWGLLDDEWLVLRYRVGNTERFLCPVGIGDPSLAIEWCFRHLDLRGQSPWSR